MLVLIGNQRNLTDEENLRVSLENGNVPRAACLLLGLFHQLHITVLRVQESSFQKKPAHTLKEICPKPGVQRQPASEAASIQKKIDPSTWNFLKTRQGLNFCHLGVDSVNLHMVHCPI